MSVLESQAKGGINVREPVVVGHIPFSPADMEGDIQNECNRIHAAVPLHVSCIDYMEFQDLNLLVLGLSTWTMEPSGEQH